MLWALLLGLEMYMFTSQLSIQVFFFVSLVGDLRDFTSINDLFAANGRTIMGNDGRNIRALAVGNIGY